MATRTSALRFAGLAGAPAAAIAGLLAATHPTIAVAVAAALAASIALRLLGASLAEIVVATIPFMFFPPIGMVLNMSVADFFVPALAIWALVVSQRDLGCTPDVARRAVTLSATFLGLVGATTVLDVALRNGSELDLALIDGAKLVVGTTLFASLAIVVSSLPETRRARLIRVWVWTASVQGLLSVLGLLPSDGQRSLGFFQDPNLYGAYLLLTLPLAFYLVTRHQMRFWVIPTGFLLLGVVSTGSRGAIVAAGVLVVATVLFLGTTRVGAALFALLLLLLIVLTVHPAVLSETGLPGTSRLVESAGRTQTDPRLNLWSEAVHLWWQDPVLGIGLGQFTRFSHGLTPYVGDGVHGQVAHNTFLSFTTETGVVGLAAFMTIVLAPVLMVARSSIPAVSKRALFIGVIVLSVSMLSLNLQNLRYVWAFLAILMALSTPPPKEKNELSSQSDVALVGA